MASLAVMAGGASQPLHFLEQTLFLDNSEIMVKQR